MGPNLQTYLNNKNKEYKYGIIILPGICGLFGLFFLLNSLYIAIPSFIFSIVTFLNLINNKRKLLRKISETNENLVNQLERELDEIVEEARNNLTLTRNLIFIHESFDIIKYSDIIFMTEKMKLSNGKHSSINWYLFLVTKDLEIFALKTHTTALTVNYEVKDIKKIILKKNPKILENFTKENIKKLEQLNINVEELKYELKRNKRKLH